MLLWINYLLKFSPFWPDTFVSFKEITLKTVQIPFVIPMQTKSVNQLTIWNIFI